MFRAYLKAVLWEGWPKVTCSIFDIMGVMVFFLPDLGMWFEEHAFWARVIGAGIFFFSFLLANFLAYNELAEQLSYKADIYLEVVKGDFYPSPGGWPNPFRVGGRKNPGGFSKQGIPDWGHLHAEISINNRGYEPGKLRWEFDKARTKLPSSLFDIKSVKIVEFDPPTVIGGSSFAFTKRLAIAVLFAEQDPHAFARKLKGLVESKIRYEIFIKYRTEQPDGTLTEPRDLPIGGDFQCFYQESLEHWDNYGHRDLADLARFTDTENA